MAKELATESPIDLNVWAYSRDNFHVRSVLGLLHPGETVQDVYFDNLDWQRERADTVAHEKSVKGIRHIPLHD